MFLWMKGGRVNMFSFLCLLVKYFLGIIGIVNVDEFFFFRGFVVDLCK